VSEKRGLQRITVGVVEAEMVNGQFDRFLASSFPLRRSLHTRERGSSRNLVQRQQGLRSGLSTWMGGRAELQSGLLLKMLSMFKGPGCLRRFPILHNALAVRDDYVNMNAVIILNELPTTRSYLPKSHGWACRWAIEKLTPWPNPHDLRRNNVDS
jgi:hypothetical protein